MQAIKNNILITLIFISIISFSQDKDYARDCVTTLSGENFHGRGYVKKGDKKAAKFIESELKNWKIKPFEKSYMQEFNLDVNALYKTSFKLNTKEMTNGVDYLVFASSPSLKGKYELYYPKDFTLNEFKEQNHKNHIFVLDTFSFKSKELTENYKLIIGTSALKNAAGIIEVKSRKLVHTVRSYALDAPLIQVKKEAWNPSAKTAIVDIKSELIQDYTTQNVIGYIEGEIDSFYVIGAHYDHLGRVGKDVYFPGANDNASGVATILSLAKYYHENNIKPKYSIAFILFGAEEAGLLGSMYYTENPLFPLTKIKFLFNLDMVGTGPKGLSIVNGKSNEKASQLIEELNKENKYFTDIRIGKGSASSDHHFFDKSGVPAVFLFTRGGPQYYHNILDKIETLELNKHDEIIQLITQFIDKY